MGSVGSPRSLESPKLLKSMGFWRCDKPGEGLAQFSTAAAGIEHHGVVERFFVAWGGAWIWRDHLVLTLQSDVTHWVRLLAGVASFVGQGTETVRAVRRQPARRVRRDDSRMLANGRY